MNEEKLFETYNNKILPILLENDGIRALRFSNNNDELENDGISSSNKSPIEIMLKTKVCVNVNPSFQSKVAFVKNIFSLDHILTKIFPGENCSDLLEIYFDFISFTFNSFVNNLSLPIRNLVDTAPAYGKEKNMEVSIALNYSKKLKLIITAFISLNGKPLKEGNPLWIDKVLDLLLFNNIPLKPEKEIFNETKELNIFTYRNLILTGFDKDQVYNNLYVFWRDLPLNKIDNLFIVLDLKDLLGLTSCKENLFNCPVYLEDLHKHQWFWLHDDFKRFVYSPLRVLIKDPPFVSKIKNIPSIRLHHFFIKNSFLKDFKSLIEFKEFLGEDKVITANDVINYSVYDKLNGFLIEKENIELFKGLMFSQEINLCMEQIKKSSWAKKSILKIHLDTEIPNEKEISSKIFNEVLNYDLIIETSETSLKELEYLNKEGFLFSKFKYYEKEDLLQDKFFFIFRMMAFAFANQKIKYEKSKIEDFVKTTYENFYWVFLEEYVDFMSDRNKYLSGNFTFIYEKSNLYFNGIRLGNARKRESVLKAIIVKRMNETEVSPDDSKNYDPSDEHDFKI